MSENPQNQEPTPGGNQPEFMSRHEARMRRREERWAARGGRSGAWVVGAILIIIGIVFLLQNMNIFILTNWWALFILLPAVGAFTAAWRSYQDAGGRLTAGARGSLIGGLVLVLVAGVFLFGLNWGVVGPLLIVLAGIGLLLNAFLPG
jgi:hypothetical protein